MRVLELYSGIGGMRAALELSGLAFEIARALDVNDLANSVYNSAYNCSDASNRALESLSEEECLLFGADLWTMSPPCQPFTRMGNQKRGKDTRCSSLLIIIQLIRRIKPPAVMLENVKGFEGSDAWCAILEALIACDYDVRFLLTPLQFGIPNCRLRYYLVARLRTHNKQRMFSFGTSVDDLKGSFEKLASAIIRTPPCDVSPMPNCECGVCTNKVGGIASTENHFLEYIPFCHPIADYLLPECEIPEDLFLGQNELEKYYTILDIVTPENRKSACFTKGYAQRFEGTGSFLEVPQPSRSNSTSFPKIRAFHSKEIARLLCFPEYFDFPATVSEKQRRRLLGNSLNVLVVAHIMNWAFSTV
ncbi:DNA methyltransferase 2 putative [Echinococcus multilocularis]|uniref:DNA methyltransferase 2 putative n=1 Tax=Echinococcus multilocularis TaxID=6211 RepID=A0A068Y0L7_ECHMU|nr:DNA methyltransferase 2 putative [Echinococcus multilocularis]